jgi:demethylmenaquinone methyltransferase/2-methoxy-6-polyprenyl-1,4-benzoquinol methylase
METLAGYYAKRAPEYERIYAKPERQKDLHTLRKFVARTLAGCDVLEVACGTGWWTEVLAGTARSVVATDINDEVLAIAKTKSFPCDNVSFQRCDALRLDQVSGEFNAGLAAFWWSHLTRAALQQFMHSFHSRLKPGSTVVFIDNIYVEGSSTPISRRDADRNTYQMRKLDDGSSTEVLKNFPTDAEMAEALGDIADGLRVDRSTYYWAAHYVVRD